MTNKKSVYESIVLSSASAATLIGISVIFGWYIDNRVLLQIFPNFAPMRYNPALCVVVLGIGILCALYNQRIIAAIAGIFAFLFGFLTMVEYGLDISLGIDEIFFKQTYSLKTKWPGRMAPNAAVDLCFMGVCLFIMTIKRLRIRFILVKSLAGILLAFNLLAILGYILSIELAYDWTNGLSNFAFNAAIAFTLLSLAFYFFSSSIIQTRLNGITDNIVLSYLVLILLVGSWIYLQGKYNSEYDPLFQNINFIFQVLLFIIPLPIISLLASELINIYNELSLTKLISSIRSEALISVSTDGKITYWSDEAKELFKTQENNPTSQNIRQFLPEISLNEVLDSGSVLTYSAVTASSRHFTAEVSLCPVKDYHGITTSFGIYVSDITERIELEKAKERIAAMKSQFIATVAHEIRTPITTVHTGVSSIKPVVDQSGTDEQKSILDSISNNTEKLIDIVHDILDFQMLDYGKTTLNVEKIDIQAFLETTRTKIIEKFNEKHLELKIEVKDNISYIKGDKEKLDIVFYQLLHNAQKYTREGGATLIVDQDDSHIIITISDTGVGLHSNDFEKALAPFGQTDTKGIDTGLGLGLTICKEIIEMHKGQMLLQESQNQGTTLLIKLPKD